MRLGVWTPRPRAAGWVDPSGDRLVDLDQVRTVLAGATVRLGVGWTQGRWLDSDGVCLISAIRRSGRARATSRAVDVAWHALHGDAKEVGWVVPASIRQARVRDLTRWNDHPGRSRDEVLRLLGAADGLACGEMGRLRALDGGRVQAPRIEAQLSAAISCALPASDRAVTTIAPSPQRGASRNDCPGGAS